MMKTKFNNPLSNQTNWGIKKNRWQSILRPTLAHYALAMLCVAGLLGMANTVYADSNKLGNPQIVPPQSEFRGLTYGEWSTKWHKWANSLPLTHHPFADNADCSTGQKGNVWFIGGAAIRPDGNTTPFPPEGRDCTIKPGTALLLGLVAFSDDNEACSITTPSVVQRTNLSEAELRTRASDSLNNAYGGFRKIIIDGVEVKGLPAACDPAYPASCLSPYRVQSPVFDYTIPALDNTLTVFQGACYNDPNNNGQPYKVTGVVADGFFTMIKPLKVGKHTIQFGRLGATGSPTRLYNITVSEHKHKLPKKGFD
jgi:hypothetical protein